MTKMTMSKTQKKMTVKEFVNSGYLHELNRLYLHPLGLALAMNVPDDDEPDTDQIVTHVLDARDDPEGYLFTDGDIDLQKVQWVQGTLRARRTARKKLTGFVVQPAGSAPKGRKE